MAPDASLGPDGRQYLGPDGLPAPAPQGYEDPKPLYGYSREDVSADRGRISLNDPRMIESERRDRVMAEGRSLAAADVAGVKRRGNLRRAREKPLGLYHLLTGGSKEDQDYYNTKRAEMMNVPLEGGDMATRIRPGSDTAYSPSTGVWVDTTPRRVPASVQARRDAKARGQGHYEDPRTGMSVPVRMTGDQMSNVPTSNQSTRVSDKSIKGVRGVRKRLKDRRAAGRAAVQAKMDARSSARGGGAFGPGVPTAPTVPHPFADATPQWSRQHAQRLGAGDPRAIALQESADKHHLTSNRVALERYQAEQKSAEMLGKQEEGPAQLLSPVHRKRYASLYNQKSDVDDPDTAALRVIGVLWDTANVQQQKTPEAWSAYAMSLDSSLIGQADALVRWWYQRRQTVGGTPAVNSDGSWNSGEEFPHKDAPGLFTGYAPDRAGITAKVERPTNKAGAGQSAGGVTTPSGSPDYDAMEGTRRNRNLRGALSR